MKRNFVYSSPLSMFLTRLPVPRFTDHSQEYLERAVRYFPLVGLDSGRYQWIDFSCIEQIYRRRYSHCRFHYSRAVCNRRVSRRWLCRRMRCLWRRLDKRKNPAHYERQPAGHLWCNRADQYTGFKIFANTGIAKVSA